MTLFICGFIAGSIFATAALYTIGSVMLSKLADRRGTADADMRDIHCKRN